MFRRHRCERSGRGPMKISSVSRCRWTGWSSRALSQRANPNRSNGNGRRARLKKVAGNQVKPRHRERLIRCGLTQDTIAACEFRSVSRAEAAKLLGWERGSPGPGLAVPYLDKAGKDTDYVRVWLDNPRKDGGRKVCCESPAGQPNRAYFPPGFRKLMRDRFLLIANGEMGAAAAVQAGYACVGVVGRDGWRKDGPQPANGEPNLSCELIADLDGINWDKIETVYVALDSETACLAAGHLIENELAEVLRGKGVTEPRKSEDVHQEFARLSSPVGAFVEDRCEVSPDAEVSVDHLWREWGIWCGANGADVGTKEQFGAKLRSAVPGVEKRRSRVSGVNGSRLTFYKGIRLRVT